MAKQEITFIIKKESNIPEFPWQVTAISDRGTWPIMCATSYKKCIKVVYEYEFVLKVLMEYFIRGKEKEW